ncbi:magnesium transporter CorA family protein [Enterococcus asini]|uniref:magnesium transporter CorA family protein n=1 Tax=Enterococcus asini TaxID=57732 RepID=UPI00288FC8C0|nr:magnesium transporter CorA family protein [Enterococcus asini]MDT2756430.1 magnesium transporter CorA family protein [Enterococcus asini]
MIDYYALDGECLRKANKDGEDVSWIHLAKPTSAEITMVSKHYQLPKDYLTAVLDDVETARLEGDPKPDHKRPLLFVLEFPFVTTSASGYLQYNTYPLSLILLPDRKLITVSNHKPPFFDKLFNNPVKENDLTPKVNIFLSLLWELTFSYNRHLEEINQQVNQLEAKIRVATENESLYQVMDIQKSLVFFQESTSANYEVLKKLFTADSLDDRHSFRNHLHDILVETRQSMTTSRIYLKLVSQMTEMFSAIVSNNLNNIMKILTSLTIVLTIPTIIGGLFGMNVKLPFASLDIAFLLITLGTIVLCVAVIHYLRKKNLL